MNADTSVDGPFFLPEPAGVMNRFFPFLPPYCPPKGDCGGLHSPREAQRGAHPPDQTSSSQLTPTMKIRVDRIIVISDSFPLEAQLEADWQSPPLEVGPTWNHKGSHSEGGAGEDEMVPCSPLAKHSCSEAERAKRERTGGIEKRDQSLSVYIIEVVGIIFSFSPYCPS
jgi:hypothetical protein